MLATLLISAAWAAPEPAPATSSADQDWTAVVEAAAALGAAGQVQEAHAALDLALRQPLPPALQTRAVAVREELPLSRRQLDAMTQLAVGQALIGAYLAGPHVARLTYDPQRSATPYYLGALGGVAVGAGSAIWLGTRPGFDIGESHTLLTAEVLGGATGVAIGYLADEYDQTGPAWGLIGGVAGGAALGAWMTTLDPSPTATFAAQSGALWGAGLATAGVIFVASGKEHFSVESPQGVVVPLVVGADVGAALGLLLTDQLDLTTRQLAFADLGAGLGGGAGGLICGIMGADGDLDGQFASVLVAAMSVGGGVATAALAGPQRQGHHVPVAAAALSGSPGHLQVALPLPSFTPTSDDQRVRLQLVDMRF